MGYSEFGDDMATMGNASGMIYGHLAPPPHHPHRCPGCQPRTTAVGYEDKWDLWHKLNRKWMDRGEPHACPIVRGETLPPVVPQVRPTLPHLGELYGAQKRAKPQAAQAVAEEPAESVAEKAPEKTRVQRARKAKEVSKGQGSLF